MPDDTTTPTQTQALVYRRLTLTFEWAASDRLIRLVGDAAKTVTRKLERGITIRAAIVLSDATTTALDLTHPSVRWRQDPPDRGSPQRRSRCMAGTRHASSNATSGRSNRTVRA